MTMKKITLSVLAAGMLFGTDAMADRVSEKGNLSIQGGVADGVNDKITVAQELVTASSLPGNNIPAVNLGQLVFKTKIGGSGTVSDPVFKFTIPNAGLSATNLKIVEINSTGGIATDNVATLNGGFVDNVLTFEGNDNVNVYNNKFYAIVKDDNTSADINVSINAAIADNNISVKLYSTSGTEEEVSHAWFMPFETKSQFEFVCDSKLDALINVENGSKNFVPTGHGVQDYNGSINQYDADVDALNFTVINNRIVNDIEVAMDGNGTEVRLYPTALSADNNYTNMFSALTLTLTNIDNGNVEGNGTVSPNNDYIAFNFNSAIKDGRTRYSGTIKTDMTKGLLPTAWSAAGLVDNNNSLTTLPNAAGNPTTAEVGEWQSYVYIAQIPGATNDDITQTKLFITNRSCKAVSPIITFIYKGKTVDITAPSIGVDTQGKFLLDTLIDGNSAAFTAAGIPTRARYAIEITIPGNAEDFYIYAQAQSRTKVEGTKDLPVYNTSTRTY